MRHGTLIWCYSFHYYPSNSIFPAFNVNTDVNKASLSERVKQASEEALTYFDDWWQSGDGDREQSGEP